MADNATVAGAVKTAVETAGLGLAAYRDRVPAQAALPYCLIHEGIGTTVMMHGDTDDPNRDEALREQMQLDLWQAKRDPRTGATIERYDLPDRLIFALHGTLLPTSPTHVYGMRVLESRRLADPNDNLVHHALTLVIDRRSQGAQTVPGRAGG